MDDKEKFAKLLLAVWDLSQEINSVVAEGSFADWCGHTKDLLIDLGMVWDSRTGEYVIRAPSLG